jgi:hypothetical protein
MATTQFALCDASARRLRYCLKLARPMLQAEVDRKRRGELSACHTRVL